MSEGADTPDVEDEEGLFAYIVKEFKRNPKENIAFIVFFLLFAGFLVFWWLQIVLSR